MPVGIVECLEMIDVNDEQGQRVVLAESPAPFFLDGFVEGAAVGDSGQPVFACERLQLRFENFLLMDITHGENDVGRPARARVKNRAAVRLHPDHRTIASLDAKLKFHMGQMS